MSRIRSINLSEEAHHVLTIYKAFNRCKTLSDAVHLAVEKASEGEKR